MPQVSASASAAASMKTVVVRFADADADAAADAAADYCSFRRRTKLRSTPTLPQEADFWVVRLPDAAANFLVNYTNVNYTNVTIFFFIHHKLN